MPLLDALPQTEKIDCSEHSARSSSLLCRLLPLGLHYDISQVESGSSDGQTVRVLVTTQSSDAIVYVTIVVVVYIVIFIALVATSYRRNVERIRQRRQRKRRPTATVVECRDDGQVHCQTRETLVNATSV